MKYFDVEISKLLPIEEYLKWRRVEEFALTDREEDIEPITIINYGTEDFLTCDGHNRTFARLLKGNSTVPAKLVESKWDEIKERIIRPDGEGTFGNGYSIKRIRYGYENYWKPSLVKRGIERFEDYRKVYSPSVEELTKRLKTRSRWARED